MHPNTLTQNPAVVLREGARYLAEHGWIQGTTYQDVPGSSHPKASVLGALALVVHGQRHQQLFDGILPGRQALIETVQALHDYLIEVYPWRDVIGPKSWNDGDRSAGEVIAALDAAADRWDRRQGGAA